MSTPALSPALQTPELPSNHVFDNLEAYVRELGGTTIIRKVLIANNGIAAVKAIRFMRKWAYEVFGNEKEVRVCVFVRCPHSCTPL
jgi:hypothetical protein